MTTIIKAMLVFAIVFVLTIPALGAAVTLAWDPNTEPDLAGYKVFYRTHGSTYDYTDPIWAGAETTCTVDVAADGYFVARAFDTSGLESNDSNEEFEGRITSPENPKSLIIQMINAAIKTLKDVRALVSRLDAG